MRKSSPSSIPAPTRFLILGWAILLAAAYGQLLVHPDLHTACPENDTWNLPIRWSVLSSLRDGRIPLWNPLSAFGIPWLATWQTETFYPGTFLFKWFGLSAWNYSGLLHLLIFSAGIYRFLRLSKVKPSWAFLSAAIALLDGCAYNHLGSNSSMDTMAWMPWLFVATSEKLGQKPYSGFWFALLLALQVFAGYPQIIFYSLAGCFAFAIFSKGWRSLGQFFLPFALGLAVSAAQWMPSVEYFFLQCVRLPAVLDNPHFFLPLENLKTLFDFNALSSDGKPDYVVNPTFFYFNLYAGFIPLAALGLGIYRFQKLKPFSRFFLVGFFLLILWALGFFLKPLDFIHIPIPAFLETAKCWVLINLFELLAVGLLLEDLFPKPGKWKWAFLMIVVLNLLYPIWTHPLERNLTPPDPRLEEESEKIRALLGTGRALILPDSSEHTALYTPMPDPEQKPLFKHFVPNSNLFEALPVATFYGSTWPTWGALDASYYFQNGFPYGHGTLLDMLGVNLLYLPGNSMESRFKRIRTDGSWTLWENPGAVGNDYFFTGIPQTATRKEAFSAFANGSLNPHENLFLDPQPISLAALHFADSHHPPAPVLFPPKGKGNYLVITQNAMPGWRAWADGLPLDIYLADGIFQCVSIPEGTGWVKLLYEPTSFRFGLFISLLVLVGLGARKGYQNLTGG
jgi:hypothetical protein